MSKSTHVSLGVAAVLAFLLRKGLIEAFIEAQRWSPV
jgi:hypothetical protein